MIVKYCSKTILIFFSFFSITQLEFVMHEFLRAYHLKLNQTSWICRQIPHKQIIIEFNRKLPNDSPVSQTNAHSQHNTPITTTTSSSQKHSMNVPAYHQSETIWVSSDPFLVELSLFLSLYLYPCVFLGSRRVLAGLRLAKRLMRSCQSNRRRHILLSVLAIACHRTVCACGLDWFWFGFAQRYIIIHCGTPSISVLCFCSNSPISFAIQRRLNDEKPFAQRIRREMYIWKTKTQEYLHVIFGGVYRHTKCIYAMDICMMSTTQPIYIYITYASDMVELNVVLYVMDIWVVIYGKRQCVCAVQTGAWFATD